MYENTLDDSRLLLCGVGGIKKMMILLASFFVCLFDGFVMLSTGIKKRNDRAAISRRRYIAGFVDTLLSAHQYLIHQYTL